MFCTSTQKKFWLFSEEEELKKNRQFANQRFISLTSESKKKKLDLHFLTSDEELVLVKHYEYVLKDFLQNFTPKNELLPNGVKGTIYHLYKRFYLVSSVMDFHPKEIMFTCTFLACKICEYNVPIDIFVKNIKGNPLILKNIIIDQEMELLYRLNFKLNVHVPYRAVEGLMIDLKTRSKLKQPELLNEQINWFLARMWFTDVCLLYSPPHIALAAVMHAVSFSKKNIDKYIIQTLLNYPSEDALHNIVKIIRKIRTTVMNAEPCPPKEIVCPLKTLLAKCRNPQHDPSSDVFKARMMEHRLESYLCSDGLSNP